MAWWMWILAGGVLVLLELATPGGFYTLFFALAAFAVGVLAAAGWGGPPWVQATIFAVLSVASLLLFRKRLLARFHAASPAAMADVVGGVATLEGAVPPGGRGKAEYRGTRWDVRNDGDTPLSAGQRCRIKRAEGLTLHVEAE